MDTVDCLLASCGKGARVCQGVEGGLATSCGCLSQNTLVVCRKLCAQNVAHTLTH